jgi:ADP-heptose:LPS heptosyltransferase
LVVKLDAIGDVLRSASMLPLIITRHAAPYIAWVTRPESVELVGMMQHIDEVIPLTEQGLLRVKTGGWNCVYSLSNDLNSASIAVTAAAPIIGYGINERGMIAPSNEAALHWLQMAAFDRLKKQNTESYQKLMLRIIGAPDSPIVPPALTIPLALRTIAAARLQQLFGNSTPRTIAINVGAGGRWPKKMLDGRQIAAVVRELRQRSDADILLVGGPAEAGKAATISALVSGGVQAAITETVPEFIALLAETRLLICGDTLALHIATALALPVIALFGPTSATEIPEFDGLISKIMVRELACLGCYGDCTKQPNCMSLIDTAQLADLAVQRLSREMQ